MMKKKIAFLGLFLAIGTLTWAQENVLTVFGGYAWVNAEFVESNTTGFRAGVVYEYNPLEGALYHGLSVSYVGTKASIMTRDPGSTEDVSGDLSITSWPIYYAPRYVFLDKGIKMFIKGAIGMHFSNITWDGPANTRYPAEVNEFGLYAGAGAGFMFDINEKLFINAEYEWAFMADYYVGDAFVNTASGGIGFRF